MAHSAAVAVSGQVLGNEIFRNPLVRKVFIVSGGRTATTLFGKRLGDTFSNVFSIHEPDRVDLTSSSALASAAAVLRQGVFRMGLLKALGRAGTRNLSLRRLQGLVDQSRAQEWFLADRRHLGAIDEAVYAEANYQLFGVIEDCLAFPNSTAILVLRDPLTWIQSWLKKKWYGPEDRLTRIDALGFKRITPANVGLTNADWDRYDRTEKLAWVWGFLAERFVELEADNPEHVALFRFEDLTASDESCSSQHERFLERLLGKPASQNETEIYRNMTSNRENATQGDGPDVILPDWFLERHGALLSRFNYV